MIDKSIRQYYQEGNKVNIIQEGIKKFVPTTDQGKLDVGQIAKNVATNKLTTAATKKLAGTGILSSLGPIGMLIAYMLAKKGMTYASGKIKPDMKTSLQSFQEGMIGSPKEQKELRQLEKRRANILQRKEEGKSYSDKNLDIVTRAIAEAKGIDINNPNEMKNIDKDISNLYSKTKTPISKQDEEFAETGDYDVYSDVGTNTYTVPASEYSYEGSDEEDDALNYITPTVENIQANEDIINKITTPIYSNPNESAAADRAAATQAAAVKAEIDRQQRERDAAAAAKARVTVSVPVPRHISHGGGNGGGGGGFGKGNDPGGGAAGSPFAKGGRVDKALRGRSRDI